jgi:hypothetical protein
MAETNETRVAVEPVSWLTPEEIAPLYKVSVMAVRDWINIGVTYRKPDETKSRVRLDAKKVGRRWKVDPKALAAFITTTTGGAGADYFPPQQQETAAARKRRVDAAKRELAELLGT